MRKNIIRALGALLAFALFSPVGSLFSMGTGRPLDLTSSTANWADTDQASSMFNRLQQLAWKVELEVGPLQAQEEDLNWRDQADRLTQIKTHVNEMSKDLMQLSEMQAKLEPWQQQLLGRMTPDVHELVYQTRAAIHVLNQKHNNLVLFATSYPQYVTVIANKAGQVAATVGTFNQEVRTAQKLARLQHASGIKAG